MIIIFFYYHFCLPNEIEENGKFRLHLCSSHDKDDGEAEEQLHLTAAGDGKL